ncbi:MAG: SusC/RagA family TonB-linked outer membrane protein [Bacteroidales bacterium]|nr:SusC/RagA family TonB-linked outer membrane protein [Bacteroidales bacterium]
MIIHNKIIKIAIIGTALFLTMTGTVMAQQDTLVDLGFRKAAKGKIVNAASVMNVANMQDYDNIQTVYDALSRITGVKSASNLRGKGAPLFIIDGLPRDITYLNLSEVEQITVLKDANAAALYGSASANGVVLITTKRGNSRNREINVKGHYGMYVPKALPDYLSSVDYMTNYNIARKNDGLSPLYTDAQIANYQWSGNPYQYPSVDYYSDEYLRSYRPFSRLMMDLSDGNDRASYYATAGWSHYGSLLNFGEGKSSHINNFNVRGNVDMEINDWIKTSIDMAGCFLSDRQPLVSDGASDYWAQAAVLRPHLFVPLIPIGMIHPDNETLLGSKRNIGGTYLAGGSAAYLSNPIADVYLAGNNNIVQRNFSFTNRINVDLSDITQGLSFATNFSYDFLNVHNEYIQDQYAVYNPVWVADGIIADLEKYGDDVHTGTLNVGGIVVGTRRFGASAVLDYEHTFNQVHHFSGDFVAYASQISLSSEVQSTKNTHLGLRLGYVYADKYLVDFTSALVSSAKLPPSRYTGFSPTFGLAWVVSAEDFMRQFKAIDLLKLKVSGGITNTDAQMDYFLYDDMYISSYGLGWYDGAKSRNGTLPAYGPNTHLFFEQYKDFNIGMEGVFFNRRLTIDANYFHTLRDGIAQQVFTAYPNYYTAYVPYENFGRNEYHGFEAGAWWKQKLGDLTVKAGGTLLYADSKTLKTSEIYTNDYQYRTGSPVDAVYGLVAEGLFADQGEIDVHALQAYGTVRPGDIRYKNLDGNGIVNDDDQQQIGRYEAPLVYGLDLTLSFKRFTLFAHASGQSGANGFLSGDYYWAQGDSKYSSFMLNHWTETTAQTATYPRLSSLAQSNNYRTSTFWMYSNNYFSLDRVQLTCDLPVKQGNVLAVKSLSLFIDASSILMLSKAKDYLQLNVGSQPQYRSFSIGFKTLF